MIPVPRRLAPALLLALWPHAAAAQPEVRVQSGEHPAFSRLVFYLPSARDWRLGRAEQGYTFDVDGDALRFDLGTVFDFIPRTRIAAIDPSETGLQIALACDCHAEAFDYRPGIVVVDIRDGPPPPDSPFEAATATLPDAERGGPTLPAPRGLPESLRQPGVALPGLAERFAARPEVLPDPAEATAPVPDPGAFRVDMVERLGAAMSQGLVEPMTPEREQPARDPLPADARASAPEVDRESVGETIEAGGGYAVATAFDMAFGGADRTDASAAGCRSEAKFAFMTPASGTDLSQELVRAQLSVSEGQPTQEQGLALAQAYLALGFGAEARHAIERFANGGPEAEFLLDIARVVDQPASVPQATAARLVPHVACDTPASFWAVLASGGRNLPGPVNGPAVLRTASNLPQHLRLHLVPPLSQALRTAREDDLAHAVRETLRRTGLDMPPGMMLEEARALEAQDTVPAPTAVPLAVPDNPAPEDRRVEATPDPEPAAAAPRPPAEPVADHRPAATLSDSGLASMADRLQQMSSGRRAIDNETLAEAAALLHESKGSVSGVELFDALLPALMRAGRHREGLAVVRRLAGSGHADAYDLEGGRNALLADLAAGGRTADFVLALAELEPEAEATMPVALRVVLAERLSGMGLTDQARRHAPPIGPAADPDTRLLYARIALSEGAPMEALARIATLEGSEADLLRAEALAAAGAQAEASRLLLAQGRTDAASLSAWAGADWVASAGLLPQGPRRDLAARLAADSADPPDALSPGTGVGDAAVLDVEGDDFEGPQPYLARRRDLIERSAALRATVRQSLSAPVTSGQGYAGGASGQ